jgi:hypothetical protein
MVAHFEWPDILQPQKRDFFSGLDTDFRILMRTNAKYSTGEDGFSAVGSRHSATKKRLWAVERSVFGHDMAFRVAESESYLFKLTVETDYHAPQ